MTAFDWCVAGKESTWGTNLSNGAGDLGWFQFTEQTYDYVLSQLRLHGTNTQGWDLDPETAPVAQQVAAFNYWEPIAGSSSEGWPNTVPMCGG
jgi:hypothetical protein